MYHEQEMEPQRALQEMMGRPEEEIRLAEAALLIAAVEYPGLEPEKYLRRLDQMADVVRQRLGAQTDALEMIGQINRYLYEEEGFLGNAEDYYDSRNSFLNEVLDRKRGIPITLATVYLEIAWRLPFPLVGVGMPGHFLVKQPHFDILIDPFAGGKIVSVEECSQRMKHLLGEETPFYESFLDGVGKRHIVARMLNNLRNIYLNARQFQKALRVTEMALSFQPDAPMERKQRAALLLHLRRYTEAIADLNAYLATSPDAEDAETIRQTIASLKQMQAQMN